MNATDEDNDHCTDDDAPNGSFDYRAYPPQRPPDDGGSLNVSSNILLVYRLDEMRRMENINFVLAILCLLYCGMNVALIIVNYVNSHNEDDPPVSERT